MKRQSYFLTAELSELAMTVVLQRPPSGEGASDAAETKRRVAIHGLTSFGSLAPALRCV